MKNPMKHLRVEANGITLHVIELGKGPAVLFCHGFPDTWRGWRRQMEAVAAAGFHAIALDMRGYGQSSAPEDPHAYTVLHTIGDAIGVLDALGISEAVIVGHDFGAATAWNAALMRPDRFRGVFGMSVPACTWKASLLLTSNADGSLLRLRQGVLKKLSSETVGDNKRPDRNSPSRSRVPGRCCRPAETPVSTR
jgi:pimeloyl-ACP methyl ester carboxylesterase